MGTPFHVYKDGSPSIVRVEEIEASANEWARTAREMHPDTRFRIVARVLRACGAQTMVYAVVATLRRSFGVEGCECRCHAEPTLAANIHCATCHVAG